MKFSFDEFHIWYQFALSLICAEKVGIVNVPQERFESHRFEPEGDLEISALLSSVYQSIIGAATVYEIESKTSDSVPPCCENLLRAPQHGTPSRIDFRAESSLLFAIACDEVRVWVYRSQVHREWAVRCKMERLHFPVRRRLGLREDRFGTGRGPANGLEVFCRPRHWLQFAGRGSSTEEYQAGLATKGAKCVQSVKFRFFGNFLLGTPDAQKDRM